MDTLRQFPANTLIQWKLALLPITYWGRTFQSIGLIVRLIPTQHVKAFTRHQKNDANDPLAICGAALRPGIHFVTIKTVGQQDIKALRSARQLMVEQRTAVENQARALAAEQGIELPVGVHILSQRLPDERIRSTEHNILALCQQLPKYKILMTIPGVGPLIAAAFLSEVNAEQFTNGRQLSSWCGLVPGQRSSGGKKICPQ